MIRKIQHGNFSFNGRLNMNKEKVAQAIKYAPQEQHESLIGNINTLKNRIETMTPDNKNYTLDYETEFYRPSIFDDQMAPVVHTRHGEIKVTDDDNAKCYEKSFKLTYVNDRDKTTERMVSGESIWQNGFRDITEQILRPFNQPEKKVDSETKSIMDKLG